jgi:hypothetical protein
MDYQLSEEANDELLISRAAPAFSSAQMVRAGDATVSCR